MKIEDGSVACCKATINHRWITAHIVCLIVRMQSLFLDTAVLQFSGVFVELPKTAYSVWHSTVTEVANSLILSYWQDIT